MIDLAGPDYARDPHAAFAAMRAEGPLLRTKVPFVGRVWTTSTHEAATAVLKSDAFVVEGRNVEGARRSGTPGVRWWMPHFVRVLTHNMLGRDDPEHRRLRQLVDGAFRRRDVLAMRDEVNTRARAMIAALPAEADLLGEFSRPFPLHVVADLLGLREESRADFVRLAAPLGEIGSPLGFLRAMRPIRRLVRLVEEEIAAARSEPRPGIVGELVAVEDELTGEELLATVVLLLIAGYETTSHLIANAVVALQESPDARERWLVERDPLGLEELLRFASPVHATKPRYVARDTELLGTRLAAGEIVMPWLGAANADPGVFEAPDTLRIDRFPNPHLVFSTGVHFCLGAQLARIEADAALRSIYERGGLEMLGEPRWSARIGTRQVSALPVRFR